MRFLFQPPLSFNHRAPQGAFLFFNSMTTTTKKTETYSLMQDIIDEVLGTYKSVNDANETVIKEGFQKALAELHKISF